MLDHCKLTGRHFGRWKVVSRWHPDPAVPDGTAGTKWLCKCSCGKEKIVRYGALISGRSRSCGCLRREMLAARRKPRIPVARVAAGYLWKGKVWALPDLACSENVCRRSLWNYLQRGHTIGRAVSLLQQRGRVFSAPRT